MSMGDEVKSGFAAARLRAMFERAGLDVGQAIEAVEGLRSMVALLALVIERNADAAPNHLTISLLAADGAWEVTVRKHEGTTPADRIAELESECDVLLRLLGDLEAGEADWNDVRDALEKRGVGREEG